MSEQISIYESTYLQLRQAERCVEEIIHIMDTSFDIQEDVLKYQMIKEVINKYEKTILRIK